MGRDDEPVALPPLPADGNLDPHVGLDDAEDMPGAWSPQSHTPEGLPDLPNDVPPLYNPASAPSPMQAALGSVRPPPLYARAMQRGAVQFVVAWSDNGRWAELGAIPATATAFDIARKWRKPGTFKLTPIDMNGDEVLVPQVVDIAAEHEAFRQVEAADRVVAASPGLAATVHAGGISPEVWRLIEDERRRADVMLEQERTKLDSERRQVGDKEHEVHKILANLSQSNMADVMSTHEKLIAADQARQDRLAQKQAEEDARLRELERARAEADTKRMEGFMSLALKQMESATQLQINILAKESERSMSWAQLQMQAAETRSREHAAAVLAEAARREAAAKEDREAAERRHAVELERQREHSAAMLQLFKAQMEAQNPSSKIAAIVDEVLPIKDLIASLRGGDDNEEAERPSWVDKLIEGGFGLVSQLATMQANANGQMQPEFVQARTTAPPAIGQQAPAPAPAPPPADAPAPDVVEVIEAPVNKAAALPPDVQKHGRLIVEGLVERLIATPDQSQWDGIVLAALATDAKAQAYIGAVSVSGALAEAACPEDIATAIVYRLRQKQAAGIIPKAVPV